MIALVLGGSGRLGRRLVPDLAARGHAVVAPSHGECDATIRRDVDRQIGRVRPHVVVSLVGYTDVPGCERDPRKARSLNAEAAWTVADACRKASVPFLWTSTDYVVDGGPTPAEPEPDALSFGRLRLNRASQYALTKNDGEGFVIASGGTVARVAFCSPEDLVRWSWVDGYGLASREWVERTSRRLAILVGLVAEEGGARLQARVRGRIVHVGPIAGVDDGPLGPWRTHADLLRARFPDHRALLDVVRSPQERMQRSGTYGPGDTRFADCDPRLALEPG